MSFSFGIFNSGRESWLPPQTAEVDIFVQRTLLVTAADGECREEGEVYDGEDDDNDEIALAGGDAAALGAAGGCLSWIILARTVVILLQANIVSLVSSASCPVLGLTKSSNWEAAENGHLVSWTDLARRTMRRITVTLQSLMISRWD